jgi:hypothetical protein
VPGQPSHRCIAVLACFVALVVLLLWGPRPGDPAIRNALGLLLGFVVGNRMCGRATSASPALR